MLTTLYLISVASTGPGGPRVWRAASRFQPPVLRCCIPPSPANAGARAELGPGAVSGSEANRPPKKGRIAPPQPEGAFLPFGRLPGSDFLYLLVTTPQFELVVAAIVLISTLAYALETLPTGTLTAPMERLVSKADEATTGLFVVEYFLRWWSRSLRPSYVVKPLMVIDLFSIGNPPPSLPPPTHTHKHTHTHTHLIEPSRLW
ncbi:hypothetical protein T492DRAFT_469813 [Pavlovales sp. CCMP2436]|nr:hypothetical protein T492DRAFT_469813 [Pavlovales sp. CCMP2436]